MFIYCLLWSRLYVGALKKPRAHEQVMVEGNFPFIRKKTGAEPDSNGGGTPTCGRSGGGGEK